MKIGNLELINPFLLAPLAGITDGPFRRLCHEQGCSLVCSEMVSAKGIHYGDKATEMLLTVYEDELPIAFQIFGSEPDIMAEAAEYLNDRQNSVLDINMGCPVPKVVKNGDGSALMKMPELAGKVVRATSDASKKPVTVKMRLGWDENSRNAVEFAKRMEDSGAAAITVHGRTRDQYYSGAADRKAIAEVKKSVSIPVIANGDVFCGADAVSLLEETGCDGVMVARGALGNPWIFADILACYNGRPESFVPPTTEDKLNMMIRHLNNLTEEKGEYIAVRLMRKHVGWYTKGIHGAVSLRRIVNGIESAEELKSEIKKLASGITEA